MAYLRLYYSNWYAFHNSELSPVRKASYHKQTLTVWYPYHENALNLTFDDCLAITPERIGEHFRIPIPDSDMNELLYAIQNFCNDIMEDVKQTSHYSILSKPLWEKIDKDIQKRRMSDENANHRWIRKTYYGSVVMDENAIASKKWLIMYHDDRFDEYPYSKNLLFISDIDSMDISKIPLYPEKVWDIKYSDAKKLADKNGTTFLMTFGEYSKKNQAILKDAINKFIADVESRYPNEYERLGDDRGVA